MNIQRPEAGRTEAMQLLLHLFGYEEATMAQLAPEGWAHWENLCKLTIFQDVSNGKTDAHRTPPKPFTAL